MDESALICHGTFHNGFFSIWGKGGSTVLWQSETFHIQSVFFNNLTNIWLWINLGFDAIYSFGTASIHLSTNFNAGILYINIRLTSGKAISRISIHCVRVGIFSGSSFWASKSNMQKEALHPLHFSVSFPPQASCGQSRVTDVTSLTNESCSKLLLNHWNRVQLLNYHDIILLYIHILHVHIWLQGIHNILLPIILFFRSNDQPAFERWWSHNVCFHYLFLRTVKNYSRGLIFLFVMTFKISADKWRLWKMSIFLLFREVNLRINPYSMKTFICEMVEVTKLWIILHMLHIDLGLLYFCFIWMLRMIALFPFTRHNCLYHWWRDTDLVRNNSLGKPTSILEITNTSSTMNLFR